MKIYKFNLILIFVILGLPVFAQVYSDKVVGKKNTALKDSLQQSEYPYSLPIWGAKATQKGYHLPYSAGLGLNYLWQESELVISDLSVGFNGGPMHNLNEVVRFNGATATANALNFRPDIWLFPFLNVYGIIAQAKTSTAIDASIFIPDSTNTWNEVSQFSTKAEFDAHSFGFGITPTMGIGGGWMALDFNMAWTDVSALDKPVFTSIFGPRFGKTFKFKKPESNVAIWVGGFRVQFSSDTDGEVHLAELVGSADMQSKVDNGFEQVNQSQTEVDEWWNGLSEMQQNNPINQAKYDAANKALATASTLLTGIDGALSTATSSSIQYSLEKQLKDKWNFIVGSQYQLNRHFMVRAEFGFLGSRQQFIGGLQYRFGL